MLFLIAQIWKTIQMIATRRTRGEMQLSVHPQKYAKN